MGSVLRAGWLLHLWHCARVEHRGGGRRREQGLWQRGADWDVNADCPFCLPATPSTVPCTSPADTLSPTPPLPSHRHTLFLASVYNRTLIPINLLLVSDGWRAGPRRVCVGAGGRRRRVKHSHTQPRKPPSDRLYQAWTSFYTEQMWSPTCFS